MKTKLYQALAYLIVCIEDVGMEYPEDTDLFCDHCNRKINPEYGEE